MNVTVPEPVIEVAPVRQPCARVERRAGVHLDFEAKTLAHPFFPPVEENFRLELTEVWPYGISFRYTIHPSALGGGETGFQHLSSLDTCTALDPWWDPAETDFDDRCEFWLPPDRYQELVVTGETHLAVDTLARHDQTVVWKRLDTVRFQTEIQGKLQDVEALRVETSRGDRILVQADPENALILRIESMYFAWELISASF